MSDQTPRDGIGRFLLTGIGAGAVIGIVIGLMTARQKHGSSANEISETVDDLKRRAEQILQELAQTHSASDFRNR